MQLVTNVPATTLNQVGAGHLLSAAAGMSVAKLHRRLESHGKPELLTLRAAEPEIEFRDAEMVVDPGVMPVAIPPVTMATFVFEEDHTADLVTSAVVESA